MSDDVCKESLERCSKSVNGGWVFSLLESLEFKVLREENGKMHELEQVSHPFFQILLWYRPSAVHRLHFFFFVVFFLSWRKCSVLEPH